jgi:5'-nucleotidase
MKYNPVILVDMDGVIADFERGCLNKWKELYPNSPFIDIEKRTMHGIAEEYALIDDSFKGMMDSIMKSPGFFENLPLIENAEKILDNLESEGYTVFICTSPLRETDNLIGKYNWVEKHFGTKWKNRIIMTRDKTLIHGDILIDDKPKITGVIEPSFTHILFDQPYNRNENKPRITQWKDWKEVIENVLSKKNIDIDIEDDDEYTRLYKAFKILW